jgi:hypothetical protein
MSVGSDMVCPGSARTSVASNGRKISGWLSRYQFDVRIRRRLLDCQRVLAKRAAHIAPSATAVTPRMRNKSRSSSDADRDSARASDGEWRRANANRAASRVAATGERGGPDLARTH